ncbi:LacI family DNA-binding transcriptional regulator [Aerococcus sp. 1KP-2016]|uniref:LacI family DNA-binding transcriptional regulator n=1 Tax=Aerococcus sp. 1KP-2016 TaxID=1981982 RepID=UPI000B98A4D5|nr:LacI family DNA-binding transcriptional regulator [Aerococcus sp. 1KP-2016]OYQ66203.1 LacI family transcriptional regulator [Aerococcus sp. 1KP-2016]
MKAKLQDVAALAGVSVTTVSRVINHKGYLSEATIQKVEAAMKELNYFPNSLARSLQGKATKFVGLIFPNLSTIFYAELVNHLEQILFKKGYKAIICNSERDATKEQDYLQMLQSNQVDGIIAGAHNLNYDDYERINAPVVSFDRYIGKNIPIVSGDNYQGGQLATETLLRQKPKNLWMITGSNDPNSPTFLRYQAFMDVTKAMGIAGQVKSLSRDYSHLRKQMVIKQLLIEEKPDAIFCSDDLTAILVMNMAEELDLRIPEDVKIIGYDGTQFIQTYMPHLTTIGQPIEELADLLVDVLLQQIQNDNGLAQGADKYFVLPVRLIPGKTI